MIHDVRMVPMADSPRPPRGVRQLNGVSRGRWEGDTLVIETTNYANGFQIGGGAGPVLASSTPEVRLVERYTRVSKDFINWAITRRIRHRTSRGLMIRLCAPTPRFTNMPATKATAR
jgi:hypothetical protein